MRRDDLKTASVNGVGINVLAQVAKFVLQFGFQVILSRQLAPADFGMVAMVAPVVAFVAMLSDLGLTQATIQRRDLSQPILSFLFWCNCVAGLLVCLASIALAPLAAAFYHDPAITPLMAVSGGLLFLAALGAQHQALLNRNLAFSTLAKIDLISFAIGALCGIAAAMGGLSYWSLLVTQGVTTAVAVLFYWISTGWIPDRPRWEPDGGGALHFGMNLTGFNFFNFFARNLDNVLIGHYLGQYQLGIYDRAYKLLLLPLSQVSTPFAKVSLPLLSKIVHDPAAYRTAYLRLLESIVLITFPAVAFAGCHSRLLVCTVLGEPWSEVAPIFSVLAIGGIFAPIGNSTGWLFMSQDRTREMRNWGIVSALLYIGSFFAGLPWGAIGVATCYIAVGTVQAPVLWWVATRVGPVSLRALVRSMLPHLVAAATLAGLHLALLRLVAVDIWLAVALFAVSYPVYLAVVALFPDGRACLAFLTGRTRDLVRSLRRPAPCPPN